MVSSKNGFKCCECGDSIVGVVPKWRDGAPVCRNCAFKFTSQFKPIIEGNKPSITVKEDRPSNRNQVFLLAFLLAVLIPVILFLALSTNENSPLRAGDVRTDRIGDQCVENLWKISSVLQETGSVPKEIRCPASDLPYLVREIGGDTVAECPDPGKHGVAAIRVSLNEPFPKVIK